MTANPLISIIIPIYNVENFLTKTLKSVQNQTFTNFEAICINDGSTDNSADIVKSFADADKRFKWINQENQGVAAARNYGIQTAEGKYIMFLDGDDYMHPQCMELAYKIIEETKNDVCMFDYQEVIVDEQVSYDKQSDELNYEYIENPGLYLLQNMTEKMVLIWNKIFKRKLIKDFRFENMQPNEDTIFMFDVLLQVNKLPYINNKLIYYVQNPKSVTHAKSKEFYEYNDKLRNKYFVDVVRKYKKNNPDSVLIGELIKSLKSIFRDLLKKEIIKPIKKGKTFDDIKGELKLYNTYIDEGVLDINLLKYKHKIVLKLLNSGHFKLACLLLGRIL